VTRLLSQLLGEDTVRVGLEDAVNSPHILCGRYVTHEMIYTVWTLNFFKSVVMYFSARRHNLIREFCYPDGDVS
jgi:hypothetical protein